DHPDELRPRLEARIARHPHDVDERPDHEPDRAHEEGHEQHAEGARYEPLHHATSGRTSAVITSSISRSSYSSWFRKMRCTPTAAYARSRSIARSGVPTMQSCSISARYASNGPAVGSRACARRSFSTYASSVGATKNQVISDVTNPSGSRPAASTPARARANRAATSDGVPPTV